MMLTTPQQKNTTNPIEKELQNIQGHMHEKGIMIPVVLLMHFRGIILQTGTIVLPPGNPVKKACWTQDLHRDKSLMTVEKPVGQTQERMSWM